MALQHERPGTLIAHLPDAFAYHLVDAASHRDRVDYVFLEVNKAFEAMTGLTRDQVIGKRVSELCPSVLRCPPDWIEAYEQVAATGKSVRLRRHFQSADRWYEITAYGVAPGFFAAVFHDITGFERIEAELRAKKEHLEKVLESIPESICLLSPGLTIEWSGPAARKLCGQSTSLQGRKCYAAFWGRSEPCSECPALRCIKSGQLEREEFRWQGTEGDRWFEVLAWPLSEEGKITKVVELIRDVTDRKMLEEALRASEDDLRLTLHSVREGVIVADPLGRITRMNAAAERLTGWSFTEAVGKPAADVLRTINAQTGAPIPHPIVVALQTAEVVVLSGHTALVMRDGSRNNLAGSAAPIRDRAGHLTGAVMVFSDATDEYRTQTLLRESERRYRSLAENGPDIIARFDRGLRYTYINSRVGEELGKPPAHFLGRTNRELGLLEGTADTWEDALRSVFDSRSPRTIALELDTPGGTKYYQAVLVPEQADDGSVTAVIAVTRNITETAVALRSLRESHHYLSTLLDNAPDMIVRFDTQLRLIYCNAAVTKHTGAPKGWFLGKAVLDVQGPPPAQHQAVHAALQHCLETGEESEHEGVFATPAGDKHFLIRIVPERDETGNIRSILTVTRDITELRRAREASNAAEQRLLMVLDSLDALVYVTDPETHEVLFVNKRGRDLWGEVESAKCWQLTQAGATGPCAFCTGDNGEPVREFYSSADGRWYDCRYRPIQWSDGREVRLAVATDISTRKQTEDALRASEERYRLLVEHANEGIMVIQDGFYRYVNDKAVQIFGHGRAQLLSTPALEFVYPDDRHLILALRKERAEGHHVAVRRRFRVVTAGGDARWVETNSAVIEWQRRSAVLVLMTDVSDLLEAEEKLRYLSFHDQVTGLYNRAFFEEEFARLNTDRQLPISVIMMDVDGLKLVNDAFGHQQGDKLLSLVAQAARSAVRREDVVARWGGDEFVILLPKTSCEVARQVCQRIRVAIAQAPSESVPPSISMGYATKSEAGDERNLLKEAEELLYREKLVSRASVHRVMISALRNALREKSHETEEHGERIERICLALADAIGMVEGKAELTLLAFLHDIGKIAISEDIITKPDRLTEEEWAIIKKHPEVGYRIASTSPELMPIADAILCHHERWDGKGYPRGLAGEQIPLHARMLAIADAYDAMTHDRPYRQALTKEQARAELRRCSGTQFDPHLLDIFLRVVLPQIEDSV